MFRWRTMAGPAHLDAKLTPRLSGATTTFVFKFNNDNNRPSTVLCPSTSLRMTTKRILTFRELESLTGFLLAEFLTFYHAWIPCQ